MFRSSIFKFPSKSVSILDKCRDPRLLFTSFNCPVNLYYSSTYATFQSLVDGALIEVRLKMLLSLLIQLVCRLMTMSPLSPCGKPCSTGTHNETVKKLALFSAMINGIMIELQLRMSITWECFQFFNRIENPITFIWKMDFLNGSWIF